MFIRLLGIASDTQLKSRVKTLWQDWTEIIGEGLGNLTYRKLGIFFTDQGTIGIATSGCKVGDLLCKFDYRVAIIDNSHSSHKIIGKGITFPQGHGHESWNNIQYISLHVDLATLLSLNTYF